MNRQPLRSFVLSLTMSLVVFVVALWIGDYLIGVTTPRRAGGDKVSKQYNAVPNYWKVDDLLGAALHPGVIAHPVKTWNDEVLYEVTYTINDKGLRISPPATDSPVCMLFFGGSATFGEGVNDDQPFPWLVATGAKVNVTNFGLHGYGPAQMLAALESGWVDDMIDCTPTHVIYTVIPAHVIRTIGLVSWSKHYPEYRVTADGLAERVGNFDDWNTPYKLLRRIVKSSHTYKRFFQNRNIQLLYERDGLPTMSAIVRTAAKQVQDRYGIPLHVLGMGDERLAFLAGPVADYGGVFHHPLPTIERIPHDGHPSVLGHQTLAHYIIDEILNDPQ